jgi:Na+-transporting NADH:ubiquinone oxidoreductase subunit NqrB
MSDSTCAFGVVVYCAGHPRVHPDHRLTRRHVRDDDLDVWRKMIKVWIAGYGLQMVFTSVQDILQHVWVSDVVGCGQAQVVVVEVDVANGVLILPP